ncbi:MAG TPA: hypothetical protein VEK76_08620 [Candidatus Binatia bacterium]|nr:hypothetical protein [Candidatus Binatia bacterium]
MSFTQTHHAFVAVDEDGVNDFVTAFFTARPRYLHYGSPPFVAATGITQTEMGAIPFPFIPGGIAWRVDFGLPQIDLYPPNGPLPAPLTMAVGQFSVHAQVRLTVGCGTLDQTGDKGGTITPISTTLDVWAVGGLLVDNFGGGNGNLRFQLDELEVLGVEPESLRNVLDCVLRMMLQAALSTFTLPFHALSAGFLTLTIEAGPEIDNDQIEVWGTVS